MLLSLVSAFLVAPSKAQQSTNELKIGVLAFRGEEVALKRWQPLADYLTRTVEGYNFKIVPVSLVSASEYVNNRDIDFLVTNPGHYVELAARHQLSVLATMNRHTDAAKDGLLQYGAVIIVRKDSGISVLGDLKGKRFAAVSPRAFGGFQMAWREFERQNIDLNKGFVEFRFMGFPQDSIVKAVLDGKVDAGTVRSGLLEVLAREGRLKIDNLKVLQSRSQFSYPHKISTSLYPEWPFASLPGNPRVINERVALALLQTTLPDSRKKNMLHDCWSAPISYEDVRTLVSAFNTSGKTPDNVNAIKNANWPMMLLLAALFLIAGSLAGFQFARRGTVAATAGGPDEIDERFAELTMREQEVLCLLCRGKSSKQIAGELGISPKTVEFHRANLLQKTGAGSTPRLVQLATRFGLDQVISRGSSK